MAKLTFNHMTLKHYAEEVGKSVRTVRRWISEGKVKARKDRGGRNWLILVKNASTFYKKKKPLP